MAKKLLIYQDVVPVTAEAHGNSTLKQITSFEFARELRIAPILISEFRRACLDYPIVFITGEDQVPFPVVVLAVGDQENQYLDDQARWNADYIPAFVRRYPFVFTKSPDDDQYYLCVDQHYG
ncbi:MAG: SapC family protein, partial [Cyanobacteriota bacterium]